MDPILIKETTLSSPSPSTHDSNDDEKSERPLDKEADMAVYLDHHSESASPRTPSIRVQTAQSRQEDFADPEDGLQHAHTAQHLVPQQAPRRPKPIERGPQRKGLKALLFCCFRPDLSRDESEEEKEEEEEEAMEYKMETYHPRVVSAVV